MGCCYEYQMHSGGVAHYELHELHDSNLEALVSSNDCPVGERMGGATRFVEGSCADFEGFAPVDCNGDVNGGAVLDECGVCGGQGIPADQCDCQGNVLDECNVCGGEGIPDGQCDCEGNMLDECNVCGGQGIPD